MNRARLTRQNRASPRRVSGGSAAGAAKPEIELPEVMTHAFPPAALKGKSNPGERRTSKWAPARGSQLRPAYWFSLPITASTCSSGAEETRKTPE